MIVKLKRWARRRRDRADNFLSWHLMVFFCRLYERMVRYRGDRGVEIMVTYINRTSAYVSGRHRGHAR